MAIHWVSFVAGVFCGFGLAVGLLAAVAVLGTRRKSPVVGNGFNGSIPTGVRDESVRFKNGRAVETPPKTDKTMWDK